MRKRAPKWASGGNWRPGSGSGWRKGTLRDQCTHEAASVEGVLAYHVEA